MKKWHIYTLSFLFPLLTLTIGMIFMGLAPFGDNSLMIIDGLHQYMPFFSILYDKIHAGESLFYTFRTGLGVNFLALFAYYLSCPVNILVALFKRGQLPVIVSWFIIVKLAFCGLTASVYFTNKSKKRDFHIVALAMAYALNGYMVGYCWNVMWLDAIMMLPLIALGIERLIDGKGGRLYCLALFYALYCNYYIAFMLCIFSVIWFLFYHFHSVKQFFLRGFSFAGYSFLAAGMSSILLIPAYLGIKQTASGDSMVLPDHNWLTSFWALIARQFNMAYPITHDNFDGNANLYFGIFAVLFAVLYLFNKKIHFVDKLKKIILIIFFYLSFNEEILNFIWHGFHNQYGIPNRFSFIYGFLLLTMAFEVLENKDSIRMAEPGIALMASGALMGTVYYFANDKLPFEIYISAALLLGAYGMVILLGQIDKKHKEIFSYLLIFMIMGEMIVTSMLGFDSNGQISISKFFSNTEDMEEAIADFDDGTFYRSELAAAKMVDESTWYPMNAISLFGSTARAETVRRMDCLGFNTGCNEYLYKGCTPVTNLLMNVRYLYYHEDDVLNTNFVPAGHYGTMSAYENPVENMSIGYGMSLDIDNWNDNSDYPFRVLNSLCEEGYHVSGVFEDIPIYDPMTNGCTVERTNDGEYRFDYESKQMDNITFVIPAQKACDDLFIFYDGSQVETTMMYVDGEPVLNGDLSSRILSIGHVDEDSTVTITMSLKGEQTSGYIRLSAAYFDQEQFETLQNEMTSDALQVTTANDHHIEGTVEATEEEYLFFSIPYDDGWKVKVDGKNAETYSIGNAFLSVIIPEGEHEVVLDYMPSGFMAGALISGISIIIFIGLSIGIRRRKKNHSAEQMILEEDDTEENYTEEQQPASDFLESEREEGGQNDQKILENDENNSTYADSDDDIDSSGSPDGNG